MAQWLRSPHQNNYSPIALSMSVEAQLCSEIQRLHQELASLQQINQDLQQALHSHQSNNHQVETALAASEAELRALFAAMTDIVIVKDFEGRYVKIAPTRLDNLYKLPEELIGKTEFEVFPAEIASKFVGYIQTVLTTQTTIRVEFSLHIRGIERWFSTNIAPLSDRTVIWMARDITDRKQAEEALIQANAEITRLNQQLQEENLRMSAELAVTRRLQQMIVPREEELKQITGLDIAGFMQPAAEVGGDYYDVLQDNGKVKISIGDVTGHGLESSMVMLMAQTAVRTLIVNGEANSSKLLNTVNRLIYDNTRRMRSPKHMTLALLEYEAGVLRLTGQHEELIIVRTDGRIEHFDTTDLGFPLGLEFDISAFVAETKVHLYQGDVAVLYTDGITEAMNAQKEQYGLDHLHRTLIASRDRSAREICQALIADLMRHIDQQTIFDDITLLILKQR